VNDTAILDWIERHAVEVSTVESGTQIIWVENGAVKTVTGDDLRDAVRKAAGVTAAAVPEPNRCACATCGKDLTGKWSLIYGGMLFCNDPCYIRWKRGQKP